jgi:hypothetical protein
LPKKPVGEIDAERADCPDFAAALPDALTHLSIAVELGTTVQESNFPSTTTTD